LRSLLLFILFVPILSFGQTGTVKLQVKEKSNKLNRGAWEYAWIYNADTSYRQYSAIDKRKAFFDSLPADNYTVTIYSRYGNKEHQKNIKIGTNKSIKLEFDTKSNPFIEYQDSIPLIEGLNDSLMYSITWNMNGCFNWRRGWADITIQNGSYHINTQHNDSIYQKVLPIHKIVYLNKIEKSALHEPYAIHCTNRYSYIIQLDRKVYKFQRSCFDLIEHLLTED